MSQLDDPLKRPILLALYKAIRKLYPEIRIKDQELFEKAIAEEL